ncbi:calcium-dependent protein kinase 26-like protein isoform X1 [Tanacetum coccineum]
MNIAVNSVHPGIIATNIARSSALLRGNIKQKAGAVLGRQRGEKEDADLHLAWLINTHIGCDESAGVGFKTEILRIFGGASYYTCSHGERILFSVPCLSEPHMPGCVFEAMAGQAEKLPRVMHRDLKPENFLFVDKDEDLSPKAIDFGLSAFFKPGDIFTDIVGSPYYAAPEVLLRHYGSEIYKWIAGVILYILLSGVPPFWAPVDQWRWGVAPDKPIDSAVLTRLTQFSAVNKLKKMPLKVIASNLSEEIVGLTKMFKMVDTNNSGCIAFKELKDGLKNFGADLDGSGIRYLMLSASIHYAKIYMLPLTLSHMDLILAIMLDAILKAAVTMVKALEISYTCMIHLTCYGDESEHLY